MSDDKKVQLDPQILEFVNEIRKFKMQQIDQPQQTQPSYQIPNHPPKPSPPPLPPPPPPPPVQIPPQKKRCRKSKGPFQQQSQDIQRIESTPMMETRAQTSSSNQVSFVTRSQSSQIRSYAEDSESDNDEEEEENNNNNNKGEGLPISFIYGKMKINADNIYNVSNFNNNDNNSITLNSLGPNPICYLVKMTDKSAVHSLLVKEQDIKNGSHSNKVLTDFIRNCSVSSDLISNLCEDFIEPKGRAFNMDSFNIEQIIGHRSLEPDMRISQTLLNNSIHVPGLPVDTFLPSFEELIKYSNPFSFNEDETYYTVRNDGFFSIGIANNYQSNSEKSPENDLFKHNLNQKIKFFGNKFHCGFFEHSHDEFVVNNDFIKQYNNIDQDPNKNDEKIPEKVEYKIKWKNTPISESTWETYDSLVDDNNLFCPSNIDDFDKIANVYWDNLKHHKRIQERESTPLSIPEEIPSMGRNTTMTEVQKLIIRKLFENKILNRNCQIATENESGRVFATISFIQILHSMYNYNKPTMIIVEDDFSNIWKNSFKMISDLYWVQFSGSSSDRMTIKHHCLNSKPKFDVLLTDAKTLEKEEDLLTQIQWGNVFFDCFHCGLIEISFLPGSFNVVLRNLSTNNNDDSDNDDLGSNAYDLISQTDIQIRNVFEISRNKNNFVPYLFTEEIIIVPNMINSTLNSWLRTLFKSRSTRNLSLRNAGEIVEEIALALLHPSIVPAINKQLLVEYKMRKGLNEKQQLSNIQEYEFMITTCGKIMKLNQMISNREFSISVIVSSEMSVLRILMKNFLHRKIPVGIADSNIPYERLADDFAYGVILMTRDTTLTVLDKYTVSQIILYDIACSYQDDINFIQFYTRNQQIPIRRLLTANSIEPEIFLKTIKDYFDFRDLSVRLAEPFIRAAIFTSKKLSNKDENSQLINNSSNNINNKNINPNDFVTNSVHFLYPRDTMELPKMLNSIMKIVEHDDFWTSIFTNNSNSESLQGNSNGSLRTNEANIILTSLLKHGIGNWEIIAKEMDKPVEEIKVFCNLVTLSMLSNIVPNDMYKFTLASSIYWFEKNTQFVKYQFEDSQYWKKIANEEPALRTQLFTNSSFQKALSGKHGEQNLRLLEENWIVRAFLHVRKLPYIPPRFLMKTNLKNNSGNSNKENFLECMYTPEFVYKFLTCFSENSGDWEALKTITLEEIQSTTNFNNNEIDMITPDLLNSYFIEIYKSVVMDLYSFVLHKIYSGERKEIVENYKFLLPLLQVLERGPFRPNWTEFELKVVLDTIANYFVPLTAPSLSDWCEFHALTRLLTKSTEVIEYFTTFIIDNIAESPGNIKFTLGPELTVGNSLTIPPQLVSNLKTRILTLSCIRELACEPPKSFRPQASLPPNWTINDDISAIKGICQFGYEHVLDLAYVNVKAYSQNLAIDVVMDKDLSPFIDFISNRSSFLKHLKFVVVSNVVETKSPSFPDASSQNQFQNCSQNQSRQRQTMGNLDYLTSSHPIKNASQNDNQAEMNKSNNDEDGDTNLDFESMDEYDSLNIEQHDDVVFMHSIPERKKVGRRPKIPHQRQIQNNQETQNQEHGTNSSNKTKNPQPKQPIIKRKISFNFRAIPRKIIFAINGDITPKSEDESQPIESIHMNNEQQKSNSPKTNEENTPEHEGQKQGSLKFNDYDIQFVEDETPDDEESGDDDNFQDESLMNE
ncbi:hypothetical protein TRFO_23148 [Tritrichomonas foetus]|uniref:Chromo domain-containing protein n=1 Tax=Tritrichomonas foetus TaxID=1144522 RepID=A0A1J4KBU0_9EUKA|nr:hypothetical protein TRFO_23148 [Tritrichomonas foetus]|eukprot:OHT08384.1 hypothetical protein TRFO_23148 [Tritrichomonas foetus]